MVLISWWEIYSLNIFIEHIWIHSVPFCLGIGHLLRKEIMGNEVNYFNTLYILNGFWYMYDFRIMMNNITLNNPCTLCHCSWLAFEPSLHSHSRTSNSSYCIIIYEHHVLQKNGSLLKFVPLSFGLCPLRPEHGTKETPGNQPQTSCRYFHRVFSP